MEKTPRYTEGGTRDPRNPELAADERKADALRRSKDEDEKTDETSRKRQ